MTVPMPKNGGSTAAGKQQGTHSNGYYTRSRIDGVSGKASSYGESATNGGVENGHTLNGSVAKIGLANGHANGHANGARNGSHRGENGCAQQDAPQQNGVVSRHRPTNGSQTDDAPQPAGKQQPGGKPAPKSDDRPEFPSELLAQRLRMAGRLLQFTLALVLLKAVGSASVWLQAAHRSGKLQHAWEAAWTHRLELQAVPALAAAVALAVTVWRWGPRRRRPVYLLDFDCWRCDPKLKVSLKRFMQGSIACERFSQESLDFQERISSRSGLGDGHACLPPALHILPKPIITIQAAREEAEQVMFEAVERALQRTGLKPRDIDILVVNCSLFCPTPSLSAMLVNHFKMRSDVVSYNLGGMGCSAGVIAIGLADKLLQVERNAVALVVSTENITLNWYAGDERSMLIPNTLFRMGCAAIVLTNKRAARRRAKYQLQHVTRVHLGADETAYRCVYQHADEKGTTGVALDRNLVHVAGAALQANMTRMGRHVLPAGEKALFVLNWLARRVRPGLKPYIPDFRRAFDHFCLHAGGRGVIEGLGAQLRLDERQRAPAAQTLCYYGNTSSSTVWYSLGFIESCQGIRRGDTVWQVGFGSGFKCNSAVWKALRPVKDVHACWSEHEQAFR
jgi:3-ketoacyl-CoA synthase